MLGSRDEKQTSLTVCGLHPAVYYLVLGEMQICVFVISRLLQMCLSAPAQSEAVPANNFCVIFLKAGGFDLCERSTLVTQKQSILSRKF